MRPIFCSTTPPGETIAVPSHFVLTEDGRWGKPIYTNVKFPIPLDPLHPDENLTGDYRLAFWLPGEDACDAGPRPGEAWEGWRDFGRVLLRFDGLESIGLVHLNGVQIGVVRGSRLRTELDVTSVLRPGRNLLHVRVHQWSTMTYVEDQTSGGCPASSAACPWSDAPTAVSTTSGWTPATTTTGREGTSSPRSARPRTPGRSPSASRSSAWSTPSASSADLATIDVGEVTRGTPTSQAVRGRTGGVRRRWVSRTGFRTVKIVGRDMLVQTDAACACAG